MVNPYVVYDLRRVGEIGPLLLFLPKFNRHSGFNLLELFPLLFCPFPSSKKLIGFRLGVNVIAVRKPVFCKKLVHFIK